MEFNVNDIKKLNTAYSEDYCLFLEATYGPDMMSEGGGSAIEDMFLATSVQNKQLLDLGSGLGGTAFYLARQYHAKVIGIEINAEMVQQAINRIPQDLASLINFIHYEPPNLPFQDETFDVVYSKGVLTHVQYKLPIFKEVFRVLKNSGCFIIDDWLSPIQNHWGERIKKMCDAENLILYAETESIYRSKLIRADFSNIEMQDKNENYYKYNKDVVRQLENVSTKKTFIEKFGELAYQQAIEAYNLIADSINDKELLIRGFKAKKLRSE